MGGFRVSESAEADLIAIYDYTEATFGSYQAEAYLSGLERTFELLAEFPLIGLQIDDLARNIGDSGFRLITSITPKMVTGS